MARPSPVAIAVTLHLIAAMAYAFELTTEMQRDDDKNAEMHSITMYERLLNWGLDFGLNHSADRRFPPSCPR